ncbi:MAG: hypothetical protein QOI51_1041 [Nocardioidaceae bacterium]|nr:hypothetical protein [Nocardioidaceae bacterium]MDX6308795.1 hypothetical protein [Nocardioidaceae bacterium]
MLGGFLLVGCRGGAAGPVDVTGPRASGPVASQCAALVAATPSRVAGESRRVISPRDRFAAAWGDPPIVLTCGGSAPGALHATSQCFVVDRVGWLVTQRGKPVDPTRPLSGEIDFTTIGRSAYVEVRVPGPYQPAADILVDLAGPIRRHTTQPHPCR